MTTLVGLLNASEGATLYRHLKSGRARSFPLLMKGLHLQEGSCLSLAPEVRMKILTISFDADLQTCGPKGSPLEVEQEDRIAGAAIIHRPGAYPLPASDQLGLLWKVFAKGLVTTWTPSAFGRWLKWLTAIEKKHPRDPHYYLEFIGIDAPFQGKGLGSQMLQRLVGRADEERVGCLSGERQPAECAALPPFRFSNNGRGRGYRGPHMVHVEAACPSAG